MAHDETAGTRRETRLLLATIAISVGMLLLLARFRYPEEAARQTVEPAPAPLERLAARATFDELAGIMADLERRILPVISVLTAHDAAGPTYVPAVRMTPDRAVALLPGDARLKQSNRAPVILMRDVVREFVVVQPAGPATGAAVPATGIRPGPHYVAAVDVTGGTPAIRPVYIGRTDPAKDPRWSDALMGVAAGRQSMPPGAAVFSLDGAFIGLASVNPRRVTIVPAMVLRRIAEEAPPAPATRADLPFDVQPLTGDLAKAAGAERGVMISFVRDPGLPLRPGDVIQSIDGQPVASVSAYYALAQSRTPDTPVELDVVRRGESRKVTVTALAPERAEAAAGATDFGAVLRSIPGGGAEVVRIESSTPAFQAGLRQGDIIVSIDDAAQPDAETVLARYRGARSGDTLLVALHREGGHRVVALEKP